MVGKVAGTPGIATGTAGVDGGDVTLIAPAGITVNQPISTVSGAGGIQLLGPAVTTNAALVRGWGHILLNAGTVQRPAILVAPTGGVVVVHASSVISVVATGAVPLTYQWLRDGVAVPGATSNAFAFVPTNRAESDTRGFTLQRSTNLLHWIDLTTTAATVVNGNVEIEDSQLDIAPPALLPRVRTLSPCGSGLLEQTFRRFSIARIEGNTDAGLYRKNDSLERIVLGDLRRKLGVHSRSFAVSSSNGRLGKIAAETCRGGHRPDIMAGRP